MPGGVRARDLGDLTVVEVDGDLDVHGAGGLREELVRLIEAGRGHVLVDLTRVTLVDSTGIGVLVAALKRMHGSDRRMELAVADERVLRVLRIAGLTRVFTIHGSVAGALATES